MSSIIFITGRERVLTRFHCKMHRYPSPSVGGTVGWVVAIVVGDALVVAMVVGSGWVAM